MSDDLLELFRMSNISENGSNENCENSRALPRSSNRSGGNKPPSPDNKDAARADIETDVETTIDNFELSMDEGNTVSYHEIMRDEYENNDTRIAMIGNVDSGKSTLIGINSLSLYYKFYEFLNFDDNLSYFCFILYFNC